MVTNLLDNANFAVVQPAYMMQLFHSAHPFGMLVAASGGMAFVGTVIFGTIGSWSLGLVFGQPWPQWEQSTCSLRSRSCSILL